MEQEFKNIEEKLERIRPTHMSLSQKEALWSRVESRLGEVPLESPYFIFSSFTHMRVLVPALLVVLIVSTGATTALADGARPGDFLFAIDRAAESLRLSITSESKKDNVRVAIADERVEELESLISEESSRRLARSGEARNAKQAPETMMMATFATEGPAESGVAAESEVTDDSANIDAQVSFKMAPENPRFDEEYGEEKSEEDVEEEDEETMEKRNKDIEAAISLVGEISAELEEKGNKEGHDRVEEALNRLVEKIDELPDEEEDEFKKNFEFFINEKKSGVLEFETIPVPDDQLPSPEEEATTTIKSEGEVRGEKIEIDVEPHIELSRPEKLR